MAKVVRRGTSGMVHGKAGAKVHAYVSSGHLLQSLLMNGASTEESMNTHAPAPARFPALPTHCVSDQDFQGSGGQSEFISWGRGQHGRQ